jgi:thymidine phosphorylase
MRPGILFFVVGPSGAGKDTLLDGARRLMAGDDRFVFARRTITRPADAGGEEHDAITLAEFEKLESEGGFLVSWRAHGLAYGLPSALKDELARGRHVIANGSRAVIGDLAKRVPRLVVIRVTAPVEILARRLAGRGRETEADIAARLARAELSIAADVDVVDVNNDDTTETGIGRFVTAIETCRLRLVLRELPIDTGRDHTAFLPADSTVQAEDYAGPGRVEISGRDRSIRAQIALVDAGTLLEPDEIGLSKEAFRALGLPRGADVAIVRTPPQRSRDALRAKIRGGELTEDQYETVLGDIVQGRYPDAEVAAFLVAATGSLSDAEVIALAKVRSRFAQTIDWGEPIVVDKHSMGGIPGSRITLIVTPIVAAHGLAMPKTSSRAITSAAGTADAMEVLARVDLTTDEVRRAVGEARACIAWNGRMNHSALDDVMNAITRPLGLDSNRWSVASIISKKLTAGSSHVIIDLPFGPRTKLGTEAEARRLGDLFEMVGSGAGLHVEAHATDGNAPIGRGIGPALEVRDVFQVLDNRPDAPKDLREKALTFAARILSWDPAVGTVEKGRERAEALLSSGRAREALDRIVDAQGRRTKPHGPASLMKVVKADRDGIVTGIDGWAVAGIARRAGAPLDKGAGIDLLVGLGEPVEAGRPLFAIHSNDVNDLDAAFALASAGHGIAVDEGRVPNGRAV